MEVCTDAAALQRSLDDARRRGTTVGLVPTMGALHAGHRSLIDRAVSECGHVAVSIFVNPLQFGSFEDLERYPRSLDADLTVCAGSGVATVFAPGVEEMYPSWPRTSTTVSVAGLGTRWEGASRPGHFDGVTTVVAKLFSIAGACRAYFGEKDFQQLVIVRRMVADMTMPVEVVACPTVRDADGLALSSRNVRLSPDERRAAPVLRRALGAGCDALVRGEDRPGHVVAAMVSVVADEPLARLDYAAVVDAADLTTPPSLSIPVAVRLLVAARIGPVRLIDNCEGPVTEPVLAGGAAGTGVPVGGREGR
jgi:pantoate--beta-alanine ligase